MAIKPQKRPRRFLTGLISLLAVILVCGVIVGALIPTWGATRQEVARSLPGDEMAPNPVVLWTNGITIRATPEQIYPWLAQIGDTRGGFYSYTFIENLFQIASKADYRYHNAAQIHQEWQTPPKGQGIIANIMAIQETQPGQYVLATSTEALKDMRWIWLWYLEPVDGNTTRLIVRHRMQVPPGVPGPLVQAVYNAGFIMERGMMKGIRDRAEGNIPPDFADGLLAVLWLAALACGIICAVRHLKTRRGYHALGTGLEAVVVLFIFTYVQPAPLVEVLLVLILAFSVWVAYHPGKVTEMIRSRAAA